MHATIRGPLAIGLIFCLLALLEPLAAESTSHSAHHSHHHASVHATALCTWLCAAGQMAEGGRLLPAVTGRCEILEERPCPAAIPAEPIFDSRSRGPPATA
jgi:hypothetical protein